MQKNSITNKITPCCTLPFGVVYWWVSNLTLNSDADRQFIISKISQGGIISINAWKTLINSGTLESDSPLTKTDYLAWFDCSRQPNCEQLKILIESYKIGNYNPLDEYGVGWTVSEVYEEYNGKIIKKISGYFGGIGDLPQELQDNIGKYFGTNGNLVTDKDLAVDFKGQDGANGTAEIPDWIAQDYAEKSLVIKDNTIWRVPVGQSAGVGDVPGVSAKWKSLGSDEDVSLEDFSNSQDITPATLISGGYNVVGANIGTSAKNTGKIPINTKDKLFVKNTFAHASVVSLFYNAANQIIGQFPATGGVELEIKPPKNATHVLVSGIEPITVRRKSYVDDITSGAVSFLVDAGFKEEIRTGTTYVDPPFQSMKVDLFPTDEVVLMSVGWGGNYGQTNFDYYTSTNVLISSGKVPNGQVYKDVRVYPPSNAAYVIIKAYKGGAQNTLPEFYLKIMSTNYYNFAYAPKTVKTDVESQRYYDLGRNRQDLSTRVANNTYGIMLMGQSNATAVGEGTAVSDLATHGLPASQKVRQYNGTANGIYPMQVVNQQHWGIEWPLLKKLRDYRPATELHYLHKALGGTSLVTQWMPEQWHNSALGGEAADMVSAWKNLAPLVNMKCVVWIQGEHDGATAASYYQKLKNLIALLRGASGNPNLHFICMGVHKDSAMYYPAVRGAQMQLIGEDPYYHFVNPDDVPMTAGDQIHYNGAMLNILSQKIFEVIKDF